MLGFIAIGSVIAFFTTI